MQVLRATDVLISP